VARVVPAEYAVSVVEAVPVERCAVWVYAKPSVTA